MKPRDGEKLDYDPHGSPLYMAPEVFEGEFDEKCDIYRYCRNTRPSSCENTLQSYTLFSLSRGSLSFAICRSLALSTALQSRTAVLVCLSLTWLFARALSLQIPHWISLPL
jgi:serine/threonine protein kinase